MISFKAWNGGTIFLRGIMLSKATKLGRGTVSEIKEKTLMARASATRAIEAFSRPIRPCSDPELRTPLIPRSSVDGDMEFLNENSRSERMAIMTGASDISTVSTQF